MILKIFIMIYKIKMAFCGIDDIDTEILSWISDFKLFINLSILDKKSYILITNTPIYIELNKLKNHSTKFKGKNITNIYYVLGLINILKNLKKNNKHFILDNGIDCASERGHINILEWHKNSKLELKYTERAIDLASQYGRIHILEWYKNSGLEFKYTTDAIDSASQNGHIHILEWYLNSGLEFKYTTEAIDSASQNGQ